MISNIAFLGIALSDWLTIIAFLITGLGSWRAAFNAKKVLHKIRTQHTVISLSQATESIETLRTLQRLKAPSQYLFANYATLASKISRDTKNLSLPLEDRKKLLDFLVALREIESSLEESNNDPNSFDWVSANRRLVDHFDKIVSILVNIKNQ